MFLRCLYTVCGFSLLIGSMGNEVVSSQAAGAAQGDSDKSYPPAEYTIRHWTPANGLPASTIQCLCQTHDGYLWIGTRNGLVRFNGREFRTSAGINCLALCEDNDGVLWALGREGLVKWDGLRAKRYRCYESEANRLPTENGEPVREPRWRSMDRMPSSSSDQSNWFVTAILQLNRDPI